VRFLSFAVAVLLGCLAGSSSMQEQRAEGNRVMLWLCLEFCSQDQQAISENIAQIALNRDALDAVSFEKYTLGPHSTLFDNDLTPVSKQIRALGLEAWPLLSSYPHPPEFMEWMREVFAHPEPFVAQCLEEAQKYGYVGYNLDWEPTEGVKEGDAAAYAAFIDTFASQLATKGLQLSVDIASWSEVWNYTAIAQTAAARAISMGTYTSTDTSFTSQLNMLVDAFGPIRSGVGLETVNASSGEPIPMSEVEWRFEQIRQSGAREVDIWSSPVPPLWWPLIRQYKQGK